MSWWACAMWSPCDAAPTPPVFDLGWIVVTSFLWLLLFWWLDLGACWDHDNGGECDHE